jgi:REP element-mobilizing transposase RayT
MGRQPRAFVAGIYHVGSHGSDDRYLFLTEGERSVFLQRISDVADRFELGLVAFTLMGNHYHLLVRIPDARLSTAMQELHTWYSRLHNKLNGRSAHLFRARFHGREIDGDDDLLWTARYLAWNPVLAGLAADPFGWAWSSAAATAGLRPSRVPLDLAPLGDALGAGPGWRQRYRDLIDPDY